MAYYHHVLNSFFAMNGGMPCLRVMKQLDLATLQTTVAEPQWRNKRNSLRSDCEKQCLGFNPRIQPPCLIYQGWTLNFESTPHSGEWPSKCTRSHQFSLAKKFTLLTLAWASRRMLMSHPEYMITIWQLLWKVPQLAYSILILLNKKAFIY